MAGMENARALVIGIANYQHITPLPATVLNDAQAVYDLLVDPALCGYRPEHVALLTDGDATQAAIRAALARLAASADAETTVFCYVSSHGGRIEDGPYAGEYLLPVDADYASGEAVAQTAISGAELTEALRAIPARKLLVVFDCCHAGGIAQPKVAGAPALKAGFSENYYDQLRAGRGRAILASSRDSEYSWVLPGAPNSLFTQTLVAGMRGGIASEDGLIRLFDLFEYVQPRVTATRADQHPVFKAQLEENFPVALYAGGRAGSVPKTDDGYRYDVYVSYAEAEPDTSWVWDTLLPAFEAAGLKVAVSDEVAELGVARVVNVERGMQQARRTLAVLSPTYMANQMAQFENVLGQTLSVEENRARLLTAFIALVDSTELPARLSPNIIGTVELSDVTSRRGKMQLDKLVNTLKSPLGQIF
jgi:hypothetical protein